MGSSEQDEAFLLYHSFPRVGGADIHDERGLSILDSILKLGLLATPEVIKWMFVDGESFRVAQKRICFTALQKSELNDHAKIFGEISIAFRRADLEQIGAVPVFYVPRSLKQERQGRNIGGFHMERLYQLLVITQQLRTKKDVIAFRNKDINIEDVEAFIRYLTGLFAPIEDIEDGKNRFYYAQKEWRVMGNLFFRGEALSRKLSVDEMRNIELLCPEFFKKIQNFPTGEYSNIKQSLLIPKIAECTVRESIVKVVVPKRLADKVNILLEKAEINPKVVII